MKFSTKLLFSLGWLLFLFFGTVPQAFGQLSGTYTIDTNKTASLTNYKSFSSAVSDLLYGSRSDGGTANGAGVTGPVTFNVANGSYKEQIELKEVKGASSSNRITFQSTSGDSTKVKLNFPISTSAGKNYLIFLNGGDFWTIKGMTLERTGSGAYGHVVVLDSGANDNWILNNNMRTESNTSFDCMIVFSYAGVDSRNVFRSNHTHQGYYGFFLWISAAGQTQYEENTIVENNIVDSAYFNAIAMYFHKAPVCKGNTVNSLRYSPGWAIRILGNDSTYTVEGNKVNLSNGGYGMLLYNATGYSAGSPAIVANNMISVIGTTAQGIYLQDARNTALLFNSVRIENSSTGSPIYGANLGTIKIANLSAYNNNWINVSGGTTFNLDASTVAAIVGSDYNNYFTAGSTLGVAASTNYSTLKDLQKALGTDQYSITLDPKFISATNLHSKQKGLAGLATNKTGVTIDFDKEKRHSTLPDIGADELTLPPVDVHMRSILIPANPACGDSFMRPAIILQNLGSSALSNFTVYGSITGKTTTNISTVYTKTLTTKLSDTVYFSQNFNSYAGGTYSFVFYTSVSGEADRTDDTLSTSLNISAGSQKPTVPKDTLICGGKTISLIAKTKEINHLLSWYDMPVGGKPLSADTLTILLSKTDTFFAESSSQGASCGSLRARVIVKVQASPSSSISKAANFGGVYKAGTATSPDSICAGSLLSYDLAIPKGYLVSDYGKNWNFRNARTRTPKGTTGPVPTLTTPTSSITANIKVTTTAAFSDSTLIVMVDAYNILTGCDSTLIRYVKVVTKPKAKIIGENQCLGKVVLFTDSSVVGTPTATYTYNFGDGKSATTTQRYVPHTYAAAGAYTVWVKVVNALGCLDSSSVVANIYPLPVADFVVPTGGVCAFKKVTLVNKSSIPSGKLNYKWYFGDGTTDTTVLPSPTYKTAGTYTISLAITSEFGCKDSTSRTIIINQLPTVLFSANNTCAGDIVQIANSTTNAASYKWIASDGQTSTFQTPSFIFTKPGSYTLRQVATSTSGCIDSGSAVSFMIFDKPIAAFSATDGCEGDNISFTNNTKSADPISSSWDFGDGKFSSATSPSHIFPGPGTFVIKLKVSSSGGCEDTTSQTIVIGSKPVAGFKSTSGVCLGTAITFSDTSKVGVGAISSWNWTFDDGQSSTDQNPVHTYTKAGIFNVMLETYTASGCNSMAMGTVEIFAQPKVAFTAPTKACTGEQIKLTNTSTIPGGTPNYNWNFGDGSANSNQQLPSHSYTKAGTYQIELVVAGQGGCSDTMRSSIQVFYQPSAKWSASVDFRRVSFTPQDTNATSYLWDFGDGSTSTEKKPEHKYSSGFGKWYTTKLIVSGGGGCDASFTDSVIVGLENLGPLPVGVKAVKVYPNPFQQDLNVKFELLKSAKVSISLYDMSGRQVFENQFGFLPAGQYNQTLSPELPEGQYLLRLQLDNAVVTEQVIRLK